MASLPFQPVAGIPPFQPIPGRIFSMGPELAAWGPSNEFLFAFAVSTDQALWFAEVQGFVDEDPPAVWSNWRSLGGVVMSPPRAVRSGDSSIDVFAVGANCELLHWQFINGSWVTHPVVVEAHSAARVQGTPPVAHVQYSESLGGVLTSPPDAVIFGELQDELIVVARGTDQALWQRVRTNSSWSDWTSLGHILASPPRAVVADKETFAVFALGIDSAIWYTMGAEWKSLGGTFSSAPCAVVDDEGRILVFAADDQSALKWSSWNGSSWTAWQSLGGILMAPPIANAPPDLLPYVFAFGTDSGVWRRRSNGDGEPWTDWESLGVGLLTLTATTTRGSPDQFRGLAGLGLDHQVWYQEDDF